MDTQYGLPYVVESLESTEAEGLKRIRLTAGDGPGFSERWMQTLISRYPALLPIQQIEPSLTPAISVCMELRTASGGLVDNLYVTPSGHLIIGETKLYRNPEARREVIGQIIDYAKDIASLTYEQLNKAVLEAESPQGNKQRATRGLYESVAAASEVGEIVEEQFIDAVSRNLERGRFLLLIIGDGIQASIESISSFLQQHAGMHFTLGIVELSVFQMPSASKGYLVQPRVLAKTRNIDRGIVSFENGRIVARPPEQFAEKLPLTKRTSISEEDFYEKFASNFPMKVADLRSFMVKLAEIGITPAFGKKSMIVRWYSDEDHGWNLGTIEADGKVYTDLVNITANSIGLLKLSHEYLRQLADLVPGAYVKQTPKETSWYVAKGNSSISIEHLLDHQEGWIEAIENFIASVNAAMNS